MMKMIIIFKKSLKNLRILRIFLCSVFFKYFFVDCIFSFYGFKCEYYCNMFCRWDCCNKVIGVCLYGCDIGYLGFYCNFSKK